MLKIFLLPSAWKCLKEHQKKTKLLRSLLGLLLLNISAFAANGKEVVTNQFHVHLNRDHDHPDPRLLADEIARDNGFHNLGPVSERE